MSDWLIALSDAKRSRAADQWAIENAGVSGLTLMEAAAAGLADYVDRYVPEGVIAIVCGGGYCQDLEAIVDIHAATMLLATGWPRKTV